MALDISRPVNQTITDFDAAWGFPEDFDDTRLREFLTIFGGNLLDEIVDNLSVTVDVSGIALSGTETTGDVTGATNADQTRTAELE